MALARVSYARGLADAPQRRLSASHDPHGVRCDPFASIVPRPLAFDRKKRIVQKGDFDRAFRGGSRARGSILLVVARENGLGHTRLGLSVGKSIWKGAVQRNRVRRVFRESFRVSYPELPVGYDLVLIPAAPKLEPTLAPTCAELVKLARKAVARQLEKQRESTTIAPTPGSSTSAASTDPTAGREHRPKGPRRDRSGGGA